MVHRFKAFMLAGLVVLSSTIAFAQDVAPDAASDAPAAEAPTEPVVEPPAEASDPASMTPTEPESGEPVPEPAVGEEATDGSSNGTPEVKAEPKAETAEPMGGLPAFGLAYGVGLVAMGFYHLLVITNNVLPLVASLLGPLSAVMVPISYVLGIVSFLACCFLPAGQGAAINFAGDSVTGSTASMSYLWTILASYVSCYAFGCAAGLVNLGVVFAVVGAAFFAFFTGQQVPTNANTQYILAGSAITIYGIFAVVQPLVPATIYVLTRDTGSPDDGDDYVDTDDEYVRAPSAPGARPEIALGSTRAAAMAF